LSITTTQSTGSGSVANSVTYTAPATAPGPNTVTATVTPQADPSKKAQATIAIQPGISMSVSPATDTLAANHRVTLTTQVNGTRNTIHPRPRVNDADRRDRKNDVMRFCTGVHCGPLPHGRRYRPVWFPRRTLVSPQERAPAREQSLWWPTSGRSLSLKLTPA
jgi:hypothetical protein